MICPRCHGSILDGICINCGYDGGAITKPQSLGPKVEAGQLPNRISQPLHLIITKSEEIMPENMPIQLPDVPPRPEGGGQHGGHINLVIKQYYDDNKLQIENEINKYGLNKTLKRWHISGGTWQGLKKRWTGISRDMPNHSGTPPVAKKPVRERILPDAEPNYHTPVPHNDREMAIFLHGWQMGAEAMRG